MKHRSVQSYVAYALLFCTGCSTAAQFTADRSILERMTQGIVRITAQLDWNSPKENEAGTAFVVSKGDRCILATAAHVSWDRNHLAVYRFRTPTGKSISPQAGGTSYSDGGSDVSFVQLDTTACRDADPYVFPLMDNPMAEVGVGDEVFVLGHPAVSKDVQPEIPLLRAGIVASTEVKRYKQPILTLDLLAFPGLSGSPVILKRTGHVIGVLIETTGSIQRFSGFSRAAVIKQHDLSQFIEMFPPRKK
jgi:trypsin-like peptidase